MHIVVDALHCFCHCAFRAGTPSTVPGPSLNAIKVGIGLSTVYEHSPIYAPTTPNFSVVERRRTS